MKKIITLILTIFLYFNYSVKIKGQNFSYLEGFVKDEFGKPLESAYILIEEIEVKTTSDVEGKYVLKIPSGKEYTAICKYVGYETYTFKIPKLKPNERYKKDITLKIFITELNPADVKAKIPLERIGYQKIDPKHAIVIPNPTGNIEAIIKTLPGVNSNNELSSQYSVRGGNFDENLVYVNDIEIYRPLLIRAGQQEGLSFVNSDLVSQIFFSAGGFEAKFGDKMASVLDIQYKKPSEFAGSLTLSLLGGAIHTEGTIGRLAYLIGIRHKSNQYLLGSLDTEGDYKPSFTDVQTLLDFPITEKLSISFLGNYSHNLYRFIPHNRETEFGMINEAMRLKVYFDGQEKDLFETRFGALYFTHTPRNNTTLKYIISAFQSRENETFDILGQYWLDQLETDISKEGFGKPKVTLGVGSYLNHARNFLKCLVYNFEQKGKIYYENSNLQWGIKYQREEIQDKLSEWNMIDSADYTLPRPPDSVGYTIPEIQPDYPLEMRDVVKTKINLTSNRYQGYAQKTYDFEIDSTNVSLTIGIRGNYWDLNKYFVASPRIGIALNPNWQKKYIFRLSGGYYYQPPFYRELRDFDGKINYEVRPQTSIHYVAGMEHDFKAWNRPFKLVTEAYYKHMYNLIPYKIDNVRIRYFAENNSRGYATGIDFKINGEFVKGTESWLSMSIMDVKEDILNDYYYIYYNKKGEKIIKGYTLDDTPVDSVKITPGYIPRPTDQRFSVSVFFQDYLPKIPTMRMHLNLTFGTGLPIGPNSRDRYRDTLRIPPYRRVDIGFSFVLKSEDKEVKPNNPLKHFKSVWLFAEVLNLLQVNNTLSYIWIKDVRNREYAVPNYLTSRLLNFKIHFNF